MWLCKNISLCWYFLLFISLLIEKNKWSDLVVFPRWMVRAHQMCFSDSISSWQPVLSCLFLWLAVWVAGWLWRGALRGQDGAPGTQRAQELSRVAAQETRGHEICYFWESCVHENPNVDVSVLFPSSQQCTESLQGCMLEWVYWCVLGYIFMRITVKIYCTLDLLRKLVVQNGAKQVLVNTIDLLFF